MFTERTSIGLDVHARSVAAAAIDGVTGEMFQAKLTPSYDDIRSWISRLPRPVAVAYEAGPTGFDLCRELTTTGVRCEVVAPSKLQKSSGDRVKTDLLTELSDRSFGRCVRGSTGLARFASHDRRGGCAAGVVWAGGAAAGVARGDRRSVRAVSAR